MSNHEPVKPGVGQFQSVSLTGAVSSQKVTEEFEGTLSMVGHHTLECKRISVLYCKTDGSSSYESRS